MSASAPHSANAQPASVTPRPNPEAARPSSFAAVPGWMVSGILHAGIIVFLVTSGLPSCGDGQIGTGAEEGEFRDVGIYVKEPSTLQEKPEKSETEETQDTPASETASSKAETAKSAEADQAASDLLELPETKPRSVIGQSRGGPSEIGLPSAPENLVSPNAVRTPKSKGQGPGQVSFMGQTTQAQSVVYIIDTSSSMGAYDALKYAQARLKASINGLSAKQKFQIIAYNSQSPQVMRLRNRPEGELYTAVGPNLRLATQYINTFTPSGGTKHMPALVEAFKFHPDVIFWLTDAEDRLSPKQMSQLRTQLNKGGKTHIHCIKFGQGPDLKKRTGNFLKSVAAENSGSYTYIDVKKLDGPSVGFER